MKTLKIFIIIIILFICSINSLCAKKRHSYIKVDEIGESYTGKCSWFKINKRAAINPRANNYVAMRWDYDSLAKKWGFVDYDKKTKKWKTNKGKVKQQLRNCWVLIENPKTNNKIWGRPADWGPAKWTGRHIDLDPKIMKKINCKTDDILIATLYEKRQLML